jgi:nucleotide-binding universal stress UspA family protein
MFTRILLAVDGTQSGETAVSFATALALQLGSSVRVVHVNELLVGGRGYASETELESMEIVDAAVGQLRSEGVAADGVHYIANCFTIADRIAEAAKGWDADVIVLGSKRRRWFSRFGGSGLRERVTGVSGLPVLTAPAPLRMPRHGRARELQLPFPAPVDHESVVS